MDPESQNNDFNVAMKKLFHGDTMQRATGARTLGHLKEGRAVNLLIKALNKEQDSVVIHRIIEALGEIEHPKATQPILDVLSKELEKPEDFQDKAILFIIIESLMKIGDKRALQHLGLLLDSCDTDIRKRTEEAFECIDPDWKINLTKSN
jgi:HEAT repeat protein